MSDLVSLIVPVYNGEKYISSFYDQFAAQTFKNIELVFVNDGSTDGSSDMLQRLAAKDNRIKLYQKSNGGPASARNLGKAVATGDYILFADIDDYMLPTYVEYLFNLISKENADMSSCVSIKVDRTENWSNLLHNDKEIINVWNTDEAIHSFCYRILLNGYSVLKMYRKDVANMEVFPENIFEAEDYIFAYRTIKNCKKVVCGNQVQYIYFQNPDSISHQKGDTTQKYYDRWNAFLEIAEDVKNSYFDSYPGIITKCYLIAITDANRLFSKKRDSYFQRELYGFMRDHAKIVATDPSGKISTKLLGIAGMINPHIVTGICRIIFSYQAHFGMIMRRGL